MANRLVTGLTAAQARRRWLGCQLLAGALFAHSYSVCNAEEFRAGMRGDTAFAIAPANVNVDEAARHSPAPEAKRRLLRCWQHGHLIVERRIDNIPIGAKRVDGLGPAGKSGARLFALRSATCLLE
jgi:hypothetical protein